MSTESDRIRRQEKPVQIGGVSLTRLGKESPITTWPVWPPETLSRRQGRPSDSTLTVSQGATSWLWWCHLGRSWTHLHWLKPTCLKAFGTVSCGLQPVPPGFLLFSMVLPTFWVMNDQFKREPGILAVTFIGYFGWAQVSCVKCR